MRAIFRRRKRTRGRRQLLPPQDGHTPLPSALVHAKELPDRNARNSLTNPTEPLSGGGGGALLTLGYTSIQHNYPSNPLPQVCRIASFFDAIRNAAAHHAQDVVYDNGSGGSTIPAYGTPITAMEAGTVIASVSGNGPASTTYPGCAETGAPDNYVKVRGSDGYSTIYFHMTPTVSVGNSVTTGQINRTPRHFWLSRSRSSSRGSQGWF